MPVSKNRRKKYNPKAKMAKSIDNRVRRMAPRVLIAYCASEDSGFSRLFDRDCNRMLPQRDLVDRLKTLPLPWTVVAVAICKDRDGEQYVKDAVLEPPEFQVADGRQVPVPRNHAYVGAIDDYSRRHQELLRGCNRDHICSYGWVASPAGDAVEPDLVMRIMEDLGGFESPAQWEIPGLMEKLEKGETDVS